MKEIVTRYDFPDRMYYFVAKSYPSNDNTTLYVSLHNNIGVKITEFAIIAEQAARILAAMFEFINYYGGTGDSYGIEVGFTAPAMEDHIIFLQRIMPPDDEITGEPDYDNWIDTRFELSKVGLMNKREALILRCDISNDELNDLAITLFYSHLVMSPLNPETYEWVADCW